MTDLTQPPTAGGFCTRGRYDCHRWADGRCVHCGQADTRHTAGFGQFWINVPARATR